MYKNIFLTGLLIFLCTGLFSQDVDYARSTIATLASEKMHGRGYVKKGELKAAKFIRDEFKNAGLKPLLDDYFQEFDININTLPSKIDLSINGKELKAGTEYMVSASSPSIKGSFEVIYFNSDEADKRELLDFYAENDLSDKFLLVAGKLKDSIFKYRPENLAGLLLYAHKKLIWRVSDAYQVSPFPILYLKIEVAPEKIREVDIKLKSKFIEDYETRNVMAYVPGKKNPEKFIFFTAHYDHLGRMGRDVYFPGANDNASGTAMIMDLARHFSKENNEPDYSVGFIAFGGEEAGLLGSRYSAEHPPTDLENIAFLVNLDMVGSGSDGITIVNGKVLPDAFQAFKEINDEKSYLKSVKARGESCNSDHCMFYKQGVPAVFIYTRGKEFMEYHNPDDRADRLPLTEYEDLFMLLVDFVNSF